MKNFFVLISTFLFFSLVVFAQTESEKQVEWKTFSPQLEEFTVEVPDSLTAGSFSTKNENRRYTALIEGTYYFIFSDTEKEDFQYKTVLKFVENNQKSELEKQKQSSTMKFSFLGNDDFYHTIYTAKTKDRLYAFHLVSNTEDDPSVKRFFKSLKINEQFLAGNSDEQKTEKDENPVDTALPEVQKITPNEENSGQGTGRGQGSGFGIGGGRGTGNGTAGNDKTKIPTNENIENKPLNITFKAKPQYTDFARFYNINGNVRVRTTFLKDGTIGSTTAISKLPFGLTNSAITAAKQMRFEPQVHKGQKVAVTRVVVYSFTIY